MGIRPWGMVELLLGRVTRFHLERLGAIVDRVLSLEPDHVVITGDLTTTALPSEFREARRLLAPLLTVPSESRWSPGNHDRTTRRSFRTRRFEGTFGTFMPAAAFPWLHQLDDETAILGLDPTRPHFSPRRQLPEDQLQAARR